MRKYLPDKNYFIGKTVPDQHGNYVIKDYRGSGMNAHVFRAHSKEFRNDIAVKIVPKQNLKPEPIWRQEFQKANMLRSQIAVRFFSVSEWIEPESQIDCVALLSDYINGMNLKEYVQENRQNVSIGFVRDLLLAIFDLLNDMEERGIQHGDLHSGNILVEDQSRSLRGPDYAFRVTDFGSASASENGGMKDDFEQTAFVLRELLEQVDYQNANPLGKYIFNILNDHFLAKYLVETDPTRDQYARRPKQLFGLLRNIEFEFSKIQMNKASRKINDPFEFLSCEQIGDSHTLFASLYSDQFLGLSSIETRENLVLTGPRGCGKSTVFRSLSLQHRLLVDKDNPSDLSYIGIYYRCDDLYFAFPRYKSPERQEALDIPLHFITSTLLNELLISLKRWALKYFEEEFQQKEEILSRTIWKILELSRSQEPGIDTFLALSTKLQKERNRSAKKQRFVNDPRQSYGRYFGPETLMDICHALSEYLSFLEDRPFFFFIDDYSSPKITPELQRNLNRLFMQRSPLCFFKLSTESPVSYAREDIDGKAYVEGREFALINLGLIYIHAEVEEKKHFIEDVFKRRLSAIDDYPASSLEALLGSYSGLNFNTAAKHIRKGERIEIWGKESLCHLCCGDIYHIIDLVKRMVINIGGTQGLSEIQSSPKIATKEQTKAIREQAGNFLKGLRILPNGSRLVDIVTAFGNVAHSYLKHRESRNVKNNPPWQAHRIEPYEPLDLTGEAQTIYEELLRYSVFIEDVRGKSRRGKVVPRLYLRRLLVPHFNLTFSMRDSIELEPSEIRELLLSPAKFERSHLVKKGIDANQLQLPGFEMDD